MGPTALLPLRRKACWGFFRPKNPTASAGFEPANLGTKGQHATSRPPKPMINKLWDKKIFKVFIWLTLIQSGSTSLAWITWININFLMWQLFFADKVSEYILWNWQRKQQYHGWKTSTSTCKVATKNFTLSEWYRKQKAVYYKLHTCNSLIQKKKSKFYTHLTETQHVFFDSHGRCSENDKTHLKFCAECPS